MNLPEPRMLLTFALLLTGAALSTFIVLTMESEKPPDNRPELSLAYYLDDAELSGTGPDGLPLYQVWTERASQSMDDSSIALRRVRMTYTAPGNLPWDLRANAGRIPADSNLVILRGNVVAVSQDDENSTVIRTQQLDINPDTREANTDRKVIVEFNGRKLNATGMEANLETNYLKLLSNVNGKFLP